MASLYDKIFGCIAASHIGSAMGAPVEGWPKERIEREYGRLERLLPYEHYGNGWTRPPGTTEDGIERQKLMLTAIIEKRDRVTADDVLRIWLRDIKPESEGMVSEPFEATLLALARAGVPARHIGRYCPWDGLVTVSRSCHGIGIINAADPVGAARDIYDVGLLYNTEVGDGLKWASLVAGSIARSMAPDATVDSVIDTALGLSDGRVRRELERGLSIAQGIDGALEMRDPFQEIYSGRGVPYSNSWANEVVTKAFAIFKATGGDPGEAIVASVNFGRDTDCLAAISGGISGALSGSATLDPEWVKAVNAATSMNAYTNSQRTLEETARGVHSAVLSRMEKAREWLSLLEGDPST